MTSSENIKVSVVIPIYNAAEYLRAALDSVISQTLGDIEIICVDDGSTDRSLELIKNYQKSDDRIRIITENNAGPSIARNKGLSRARGEYVVFLDADDFYEPTLLEKTYSRAKEDELDIVITKFDIYNERSAKFEGNISSDHSELFDKNRTLSASTFPDHIFQCTSGYVWNKLYRRAFIVDNQLSFDPEVRVFEDTCFVMSSLAVAGSIGKVQEVLVHHRVYSEQTKKKLFKKYYRNVPEIYTKIKDFLMHRGLYVPLSQSFLNLSASRFYKIYNILWRDAKSEFWKMYHETYAEELGWKKAEPDEFESEEVRDLVASVLIYNHKQYQKSEDKGKKVKIKKVGKIISHSDKRKKIKDFFVGMFNGNNEG